MITPRKLVPAALIALALAATYGVTSASASEEPQFRAESFPVTLQGTGNQTVGTKAGTFTCPKSVQSGTATSAATWWSVKVTDSGCTIGGKPASVNWGECEIRYYTYSGFYIVCKGGGVKATVTETGCVVEVGPQELLEALSIEAVGSGTTRSFVGSLNSKKLKYTQNSKCEGGAGTFTNGTFTGELALKGLNTKEVQEGIFIE